MRAEIAETAFKWLSNIIQEGYDGLLQGTLKRERIFVGYDFFGSLGSSKDRRGFDQH